MNKDLLTSPADLETFKKTTLDAFGNGLGHLPGLDKLIVKEYPCIVIWHVREADSTLFCFNPVYLNDFNHEKTTS